MRQWAVALALVALPNAALAQSAPPKDMPMALSWLRAAGAEACPSVQAVAARVDAHLGRPAFVAPASARLFIEALITPRPSASGFAVHITLRESDAPPLGVRDIISDSPDCSVATDSAALAMALMIDPTSGTPRAHAMLPLDEPMAAAPVSAPPPPSVVQPKPPPKEEPRPQVISQPAARPSAFWRARVAAGGVGMLGQLPGVALGVGGDVALSPESRRAGFELSGRYLPSKRAEQTTGGGGDFSASAFGVGAWWTAYRGSGAALSLKLGAQVGRLEGKGFGFAPNRNASAWLLNAVADVELGLPLGAAWEGLLRLGVGVPLRRDVFESIRPAENGLIFRVSPVLGAVFLGLAWLP